MVAVRVNPLTFATRSRIDQAAGRIAARTRTYITMNDLALGAEIFDDFLLLTVAPAGQDGEQELPGPEDEVHGGPDAAAATSMASGLEDGPSSA